LRVGPRKFHSRTLATVQAHTTSLKRCSANGTAYWKSISQEEFKELDSERDKQIESGDIQVPAPRRRRSDLGQKRKRPARDMEDGEDDGERDDDEYDGEWDDEYDGDSNVRPTKRATRACRTRKGPISSDFVSEED
jgi:hypothetical protein